MKEHGIKARGKRKFVVTTDSKHNLPIAPNLLNRNFQPDAPNCVWTSDTRIFKPILAGCIWRWFLVCTVVRLWVGACSSSQAMDEVIDWLTYYNHRRLHSTLDYINPMQFEQNWLVAQLKKIA